jgi:2-keto-4-pentenoate hydratase/2-oxohepta-3-ene-1,7-dioic acid hydratase in catechol pathway
MKNVFCLGLNYMSHIRETSKGREPVATELPIFFSKAPTAVTGPFDDIPWDPRVTSQVDYEVELGVIIGIDGKNISRAGALQHVFGYTVINDVSARDLQSGHKQWLKGKSLDGFCPMGPAIVVRAGLPPLPTPTAPNGPREKT